MNDSIHIFIQVDTDELEALYNSKKGKKELSRVEVRQHCILCTQGSMSVGSPIKNFVVLAEPRQTIHFSIVPIELISLHKVYFSDIKLSKKILKGLNGPTKLKMTERHDLSFEVEIDPDVYEGETSNFELNAILEVPDAKKKDKVKKIHLCIDPKIRVIRGNDD